MNLKLDYNNVIKEYVGQQGITHEDIAEINEKIAKAIKQMKNKKEDGKMDFRKMPFCQDEVVTEINEYVEKNYKE